MNEPRKRVQMADIARLAGVSVSTVSRALAGNLQINAETREKVNQLARSLNYTINVSAQNLRLGHNRTISVVVPFHPVAHRHLSDPFFLSLIGALADTLTERGYEMLLSRVPATELERAALGFAGGRVAGLVMIGQWRQHEQLNAMATRGTPMVVWGVEIPDQLYATVGTDNLLGGHLATAHLLAEGARRIAFFGDPSLPQVGQRHRGWQQAQRDAGVEPDPALSRLAPFETGAIEAAVDQLLTEGPGFDAVFAASDLMAMTVISALRRHGRKVPHDVLVVGYDDIALASHFVPALTTVRQPVREAGAALVDLLLGQLAGTPAPSILLPTTLQIRDSSRRRVAVGG